LATRSLRLSEPCFDLPGPCGNRQVSNGGVFGFATAVADHAGVARATRQINGLQGFGKGTDLVHLDQDRICGVVVDSLLKSLGVGDE
jgi:hypothetical protein